MQHDLLLTFYGDDFTGSTDVTEVLTLNGIPAVLITDEAFLGRARELFPEARAIGLAGVSRSMTPAQMREQLPPKFTRLKQLGAPLFHYKLCSTFDSAPELGSIGEAIELGLQEYEGPVPIVVGAPDLRRYQAFGNLFATADGETYRLDRHPTMSRHPATPMREGDLRLHLQEQTERRIGLVDLLDLQADNLRDRFDSKVQAGAELVFFDVTDREHLRRIGELVWELLQEKSLFSASSSGLEYALVEYLRAAGRIPPVAMRPTFGPSEPLAVVSGSASPATRAQIDWAEQNGFDCIRLDSAALVDENERDAERERALELALRSLAEGTSVVLYSVRGNADPALAVTRQRLLQLGLDPKGIGELLGSQLGMIMRALLERADLRRVAVAGGDTCGHALGQLGVHALEIVGPISPGSPLCLAHSDWSRADRLEICLKAGQVGGADYFGVLRDGSTH